GATAPAAGCRNVHPPRLPRLLPGGALVGQVPRCDPAACPGLDPTQGVGLRRLRHHPRLRPPRPLRGWRSPRRLGLGRRHRSPLGPLLLRLAPRAPKRIIRSAQASASLSSTNSACAAAESVRLIGYLALRRRCCSRACPAAWSRRKGST